jgi:hypothetical protein
MVEISGMDCIPYSELNLPIKLLYSSIGLAAAQTRQKCISPDFIVFKVLEETDGEVYQ